MRKVAARGKVFERYRELFATASEIINRINPCEIIVVDGRASCVGTRNGSERSHQLCCEGCRNLGNSGCTVEALWCRMWLCHDVMQTAKGKKAAKELDKIERAARREDVPLPYRDSPFKILQRSLHD